MSSSVMMDCWRQCLYYLQCLYSYGLRHEFESLVWLANSCRDHQCTCFKINFLNKLVALVVSSNL